MSEITAIGPSEFYAPAIERPPIAHTLAELGRIERGTERFFRLPQHSIRGKRRARYIARPRHIALWISIRGAGLPILDVGRYFRVDRTTINHAIASIDRLIAQTPHFEGDIRALAAILNLDMPPEQLLEQKNGGQPHQGSAAANVFTPLSIHDDQKPSPDDQTGMVTGNPTTQWPEATE
jgi:hypothetical protein